MDKLEADVAALLQEASETHHRVYRIVDGDDPDWASWYADWLIQLSELPRLLGGAPVRSELVWLLVTLDKDYTRRNPAPARALGRADRRGPGLPDALPRRSLAWPSGNDEDVRPARARTAAHAVRPARVEAPDGRDGGRIRAAPSLRGAGARARAV